MSMSERWRSPALQASTREPIDQETSADANCPSPREAPCDAPIDPMSTRPAESLARVLVVDDDPAMREMLGDLLESSGLLADSVSDGASMHAALEAQDYSLLLIDLRL